MDAIEFINKLRPEKKANKNLEKWMFFGSMVKILKLQRKGAFSWNFTYELPNFQQLC